MATWAYRLPTGARAVLHISKKAAYIHQQTSNMATNPAVVERMTSLIIGHELERLQSKEKS